MDEKIKEIRGLIASGRIEDAFSILKRELPGPELLNDTLLQESQYSKIKEEEIAGTIDISEKQRLLNRVTRSTLQIILKWENILNNVETKRIDSLPKLVEEYIVVDITIGYKDSIIFYFWVALIPIGISIFYISFIVFSKQSVETLQAIASTFIASLSAFPIREIVNRKEKVIFLNAIIKTIRYLQINPQKEDIERVNGIFWDFFKNTLSKPTL